MTTLFVNGKEYVISKENTCGVETRLSKGEFYEVVIGLLKKIEENTRAV